MHCHVQHNAAFVLILVANLDPNPYLNLNLNPNHAAAAAAAAAPAPTPTPTPTPKALRWIVQHNATFTTSAGSLDYFTEDISIFDFSLTPAEMAKLDAK
jgi:diketogulonate reductase-like aldo/keto reductase